MSKSNKVYRSRKYLNKSIKNMSKTRKMRGGVVSTVSTKDAKAAAQLMAKEYEGYGFDEEGYGFGEDNTVKETTPPHPPRKIVNLSKLPHEKVKVYESNENENNHKTSSFQFPNKPKPFFNLAKMNPHPRQSRQSHKSRPTRRSDKSRQKRNVINLTNYGSVERLNTEDYGLDYAHHRPNSNSPKGHVSKKRVIYNLSKPIETNPNKKPSPHHPLFNVNH